MNKVAYIPVSIEIERVDKNELLIRWLTNDRQVFSSFSVVCNVGDCTTIEAYMPVISDIKYNLPNREP